MHEQGLAPLIRRGFIAAVATLPIVCSIAPLVPRLSDSVPDAEPPGTFSELFDHAVNTLADLDHGTQHDFMRLSKILLHDAADERRRGAASLTGASSSIKADMNALMHQHQVARPGYYLDIPPALAHGHKGVRVYVPDMGLGA